MPMIRPEGPLIALSPAAAYPERSEGSRVSFFSPPLRFRPTADGRAAVRRGFFFVLGIRRPFALQCAPHGILLPFLSRSACDRDRTRRLRRGLSGGASR